MISSSFYLFYSVSLYIYICILYIYTYIHTHMLYVSGLCFNLNRFMAQTNPRYSSLLDAADSWVKWAQSTSMGIKVIYYATPYFERLVHTSYAEAAAPYANRIISYWKPDAALEGVTTK